MGELTVSVSIDIEGGSQHLNIMLRLCANLLCVLSPDGGRRYFAPKFPAHRFCDKSCKDKWLNKIK